MVSANDATLDAMDVKILRLLQEDCTLPVAEIGKRVGLSTTPCWRRIQRLEETGVIRKRLAVLDPKAVNAGLGAIGGSYVWDKGYIGASFNQFLSVYGIPDDPEVDAE